MYRFIILNSIFICLVFFSCKKSEDRSCFKSVGDEDKLTFDLIEDIDSLFLYDNIIYNIIPSTENRIEISGGKNLLNHVDLYTANKMLQINNNNKCNFLRSFKHKVTLDLFINDIKYIYFEGSEPFTFMDTLTTDNLRLVIRDGAGSVNALVNSNLINITVTHGVGDFTLAGRTNTALLSCNTNSFCDATALVTKELLKVRSVTHGDMLVNADNVPMEVELFRNGNVKYIGTPESIVFDRIGEGDLIKID